MFQFEDSSRPKMRALLVSSIFPPEPVVSAQTSAQIAEALVSSGHEVSVVTSYPNRPSGRLFPGYSRKFSANEASATGVEIIRCFSTLSPESRMFSRLLENLTFGLTSAWQVLTMPKPDVIYANTWPIIATGILFMVARLRRVPLVMSVQDIYPETLVSQNRINDNSFLYRLMRWIDGVIVRNCAHVIVISERFYEIFHEQRQVPVERLSLIPNWIDIDQIDIGTSGRRYRRRLGITEQDFLVVYGGNIGVAAGVEGVIEAIGQVDHNRNIRLVVAGTGSQLEACKNIANRLPSQRVFFHSPWAIDETSEVLRAADLLILPTQGEQSLASVPSKLLSYMLAGRPILATALPDSDLADLIGRSRCGWVIKPGNPGLLAAQIEIIMRLDPAERERCGANGRSYVQQHFEKSACLHKVIDILEKELR